MSKTALQNIITKHHEGGKLSQVESAIIRMFDNGQEYKFLESVANELAELQEYKQLYNEMAAKLNSANSKLFEISQIVLAAGGLTQRAPDACPYCAGKGEFVNVIGKALRCNHCAGTGKRR